MKTTCKQCKYFGTEQCATARPKDGACAAFVTANSK